MLAPPPSEKHGVQRPQSDSLSEHDAAQDNIRALGRLLRGAAIVSQQDLSGYDPDGPTQDKDLHDEYEYQDEDDSDDDGDESGALTHDDDHVDWDNVDHGATLADVVSRSVAAEKWKHVAQENMASSKDDGQSLDHDPALDTKAKAAAASVANGGKQQDQPHQHRHHHHQQYTPEEQAEKLQAIQEEFGTIQPMFEGCPEEKFVAQISALLVRTVALHGSLLLTTRRLCFLALIPSNDTPTATPADDPDTPQKPEDHDPVIKAGPAILHRPGHFRHRRRVWVELRKTSLTCYPSSRKLYKPIQSTRLSQIDRILPHDWAKPNRVALSGPNRWVDLEFENKDSLMSWRREFEGATFTFNNTANKIRIVIPLERILTTETTEYPEIAHLLRIDVLDDHHDAHQASNTSEQISEDTDGLKKTPVSFAILTRSMHMISFIREALVPYFEWSHHVGYKTVQEKSPSPILEFESPRQAHHPTDAGDHEIEDPNDLATKICREFGLPTKPQDLLLYKCSLVKTLPINGTLAIGLNYLCFWHRPPFSHSPFEEVRIKLPLTTLVGVETYRAFRWHHYGLTLHVRANSDLHFDFYHRDQRKAVLDKLVHVINAFSNSPSPAKVSLEQTTHRRQNSLQTPIDIRYRPEMIPAMHEHAINLVPKVVNAPPDVNIEPKLRPRRIYCLTIGSRGDVQPYIALCKGLKHYGHHPVIVSHPEYRDWVESHDIEYRGVGGDPGALMKLSVEHRIFSPAFFKESIGKFRVWLDELLRESWEQCQGADVLIESPSTMAGIHVAEGLGIPYFRAFTMPWTKTSAYPQAFSVPSYDLGPSYNSSSYVLFDQVLWTATSGQINRWRKHMVGIPPTNLAKLDPDHVPFIYNFSPAVVPPPNDWSDRTCVSGYWFLDNPDSKWSPPEDLVAFIKKAKEDGKKVAYIGFGSIIIPNAAEVIKNIHRAVRDADVRAIFAKGWSDRKMEGDEDTPPDPEEVAVALKEEESFPEVFTVDSIPHDWLFPQIDIAMHHGGAGTTGASLRSGLVTLIKPFFGDQFFWALRVNKLGAGVRVTSLSESNIADALRSAAKDRVMIEKAHLVGETIVQENGVDKAISFMHQNMRLARLRTQAARKGTSTQAQAALDAKKQQQDAHEHSSDSEVGGPSPAGGSRYLIKMPSLKIKHLSPSSETSTSPNESGDSEQDRLSRLRGYKNAKAEDIRRRKLLEEKLASMKLDDDKVEKDYMP